MSKKELVGLLDKFIEEKNASWNHEDWLSLVSKVKEKGFDISENELGQLLEGERDVFYAKKSGTYILPKAKLTESCRNFLRSHNGEYNDEQRINFTNELSHLGTFNRNELALILESEKKKFLERKKQTTIDVGELEDLRSGITELQRKLSTRENQMAELNEMIDKQQAELIKKENLVKTHLDSSKNKDELLEVLKNDMKLERDFIDGTTRTLLEKEQALNAKEAELKAKGYEISDKLAELTKKLEYYQLLEKKSEADTNKLQKVSSDHNHQKNINNLLAKKVSLLEKQLHSKIVELERIKVVYREMHDTYGRDKAMLEDAEKKLREFGREAMEKKIEAEKGQKWVAENEKPLRELEEKLVKEKKILKERELNLAKKELTITEKYAEASAREKELLQKETKLILSYKEFEKKKSELSLLKQEVDAKFGETGKSIKARQEKIDDVLRELTKKTEVITKERKAVMNEKQRLMEKEKELKKFYYELQKLKARLDKREIDVVEKEKKIQNATEKNNKYIEDSHVSLARLKASLDKMRLELEQRERDLDDKRRKIHDEMIHVENEKLKLEKKFISMISEKS
jgi:hypothetical protein